MNLRTLGFFAVACSAPLVGCGGGRLSADAGPQDAAPQDATFKDAGSQDAAPQDATFKDAAPVVPDCPSYCAEIQANCTGANAQYFDMPSCMATCASFEVGTSTVTDTAGNTLGCRIYHAGAATRTDPATQCAQAGPAGDQLNSATPMGCSGGDVCQSFCTLEIKACGSLDAPLPGNPTDGANNPLYQYQNMVDCLSSCDGDQRGSGFDKTHVYSTMASGNSLACRLKESIMAAISVDNGKIHCNNTQAPPTGPCVGGASP